MGGPTPGPLPIPPDGTEWLTLSQAAAFLGLSPQTVGYHIKQKHLQARKLGREWIVHRTALVTFIKSQWHGAGRPRKARQDKPS